MELGNFIIGSCESMCPDAEVQLRIKERILHFFEQNPPTSTNNREKPNVLVKEFARSAAGIRTPKPSDLRTSAALHRTVEYLLERILLDDRKPFWFVYEFIFDRLRCVRQEIVIQNLNLPTTIRLLEPTVLFLAYSSYRLCEVSIGHFDPYVCNQHLQECLKKLLHCYDETESKSNAQRNRPTFECLYLLFNLGSAEAISRILSLPKHVFIDNNALQNLCLDMSVNYFGQNHYRVMLKMRRLPVILRSVAALKLQVVRREMLLRFSEAYHNKTLTVPFEWLSKVLIYSSKRKLITDCKHYKCHVSVEGQNVRFDKGSFDRTVDVIKPRQESFVNDELFQDDFNISAALLMTSN